MSDKYRQQVAQITRAISRLSLDDSGVDSRYATVGMGDKYHQQVAYITRAISPLSLDNGHGIL